MREFAQLIPDLVHAQQDSPLIPPLPSLEPEQEKRRIFEALTRWFTGRATTNRSCWSSRMYSSDLDSMLRAIFALPLSRQLELPDTLYTLTEGNPFFVEETLKSLIVAGEIFYEDGIWDRRPLNKVL